MKDLLPIIFLVYIIVISVISFILPIVDKKKAKKGKWRIKERTLFLFSGLGGSLAMYLSMVFFRHKTKHKSFMIGIPVIFFVQVAIVVAVWYFFIRG